MMIAAIAIVASNNTMADNKKSDGDKPVTDSIIVAGYVSDSFLGMPVPAHITLMTADSTVIDTVSTTYTYQKKESVWDTKIPKIGQKIIVKATSDGYEDKYLDYTVVIKKRMPYYILPKLEMKKIIAKTVDLDGVVVKGTKVQVKWRGDTLVYDASAFVLPEGSMLSSLVKQMPGAELDENGNIKINGRQVDYLTLNGKDFFKGNNKMMLDNLPYYTVKELKVYDREPKGIDLAMYGKNKKDYVMDVSLKREYQTGYILNAEAGAGTHGRWLARLFTTYNRDNTRVTGFVNANNINEDREPGEEGSWTPAKSSRGVKATKMAGLNIHSGDDALQNTFDASVTWNDADNVSNKYAENFASSGDIISKSFKSSRSKDFGIRINDKFSALNMVEKKGLDASLGFQYNTKNSNTTSTDSTFTDALINAYKGLSRAKNRSYLLNLSAGVFKMLSSGDRVWLSLWGRIDGNKPVDSFTLSSTDYIAADSSAVRDNYNDRHYSNSDFILTAGYAIQLPKSWDLRTTAGLEYQYERTHNTTYRLEQLENFDVNNYDVLPSNKQLLDPVIDGSSYNYSLYSKGISCDVSLTKDFGKNRYFSISFNGHWNREKINYYRPHCADTTARKWKPFINGWIRYNKSGKNRLTLEYYVQHLGHTISSLMPYTDTTNPLYVMINNTALKGQTYHNLTAYISRTMLRDMNVYFDASFTTYFNGTGTKTLYNQKTGVSTYMYDNVNGDWNTKLKVGLSSSLDEKKRWKIDSRIELEYKHSVDFDILYSDGSAADLEYMMTHENLSRVNTARPSTYAKLSYRNGCVFQSK